MSNYHLRNKNLSLKAKGLLSQMLSLLKEWDYTLTGLSFINREKIDAVREAIKELESAGYIVRTRERDEKGRMSSMNSRKSVRVKIHNRKIRRWKNLRRRSQHWKNLRWKIQRN